MFAEVMLQTAHVSKPSAADEYGQQSWSEPTSFACRYEPGRRLIKTSAGTQEAVEATLFTHADVAIDDLVWPPGADVDNEAEGRLVVLVEQHYDLMTGQADFKTVGI